MRIKSDKDATDAKQTGDGVVTRGVRRKGCIYTLLLGAILGLLVGLLNVLAANNRWSIQHDFFDFVDSPIHPLITAPAYWTSWPAAPTPRAVFLTICYWAIIGLFVASATCLVRNGVMRDIMRDKICGYALFFGACCGISIGSLNFLAVSNKWDVMGNWFDSFNQPVYSVLDVLQERYNIMGSDLRTQFIFWSTSAVIYWTLICLFPAFVYCVIRILVKRADVRETRMEP
jgi:hypothetical protein